MWMDTSVSKTHSSLTATLTVLEMDPTTHDGFEVADNERESSTQEHGTDTQLPAPNPFSSVLPDTFDSENEDEDEIGAKDTPADDCTTAAEQVEMHLGRGINVEAEVSNDNNQNLCRDSSRPNETNVALSPIDCAMLDILKLCHDGGASLEFYDNLFALLQKHSSQNKVDVTKLP
jgi:hypothetical protein